MSLALRPGNVSLGLHPSVQEQHPPADPFRLRPSLLPAPLSRPRRRQGQSCEARFIATYEALRALPRRVRRRLQRQWKQSLAGVALLLTLGATPTLAATTITVPAGDTAALIQAVIDANSEVAPFDGPDTIELSTGTFTFTEPYGTTITALPVISSAITMVGNGSTLHRDATATANFRLLEINDSGDFTLHDTTVSGGATPGGAEAAGF